MGGFTVVVCLYRIFCLSASVPIAQLTVHRITWLQATSSNTSATAILRCTNGVAPCAYGLRHQVQICITKLVEIARNQSNCTSHSADFQKTTDQLASNTREQTQTLHRQANNITMPRLKFIQMLIMVIDKRHINTSWPRKANKGKSLKMFIHFLSMLFKYLVVPYDHQRLVAAAVVVVVGKILVLHSAVYL